MGYSVRGDYEGTAWEAASYYGIDPQVYINLITTESGWDSDVVYGNRNSSAGAQGIAQFMPGTAAEMGVNPLDPVDALWGGARYLRQQIDYFGGDVEKGVMAYYAGAGNIERGNIDATTQNYANGILAGGLANAVSGLGALFGNAAIRTAVPPPDPSAYWIQERDDNGNPVGDPYFDYGLFAGDVEAYQSIITRGSNPNMSAEERGLINAEIANYMSQIENRKAENNLGYAELEARYAELAGTNERFYADLGENARQFGLTHGEDIRQFDLTHGEDIRQFDITEGRLMRAQEFEERATRAQAMIDELDMRIRAGELTLSEATAQFNRRFNTADLQRQIVSDLAPITVPRGSEYLPGFEAGGPVAQLYAMGGAEYTPTKITPTGVDPTVIAQNILDQTALPFEAASRAVVTPGQVQQGFGNALAQLGMV